MWPLKTRVRDVVRVGRHRLEHWRPAESGLHLGACVDLPAMDGPAAETLLGGVQQLLATATASAQSRRAMDLVVESAWLPVLLLELDGDVWAQRELEALLRHRLAQLFSTHADPVDAWELRVDYTPGASRAFGYGLPPSTKAAFEAAAAYAGLRWTSVKPAVNWGWDARRAAGLRPSDKQWWVWCEQDRAMVANMAFGRPESFHPAAATPAMPAAPEGWLHMIEAEAARTGELQDLSVLVGSWDDGPPELDTDGRVGWLCATSGTAKAEAAEVARSAGREA